MSRGGTRYGAGRPGWHVKAEHCRRLDARRLQRDGWLRPGASCLWGWNADGESLGSISLSAEAGALRLTYSLNGEPMAQRVPILLTACHYGGARSWFACPNCGARVAILYLRRAFACRKCSRVAYASQSDDDVGRAWRKQWKAEAKLGEHWRRPKGMHQSTHSKLIAVILECEQQRDAALLYYAARHFPHLIPEGF